VLLLSLAGAVVLGLLSCGIELTPDGWPQRASAPLVGDFVAHLLAIGAATAALVGVSAGLSLLTAHRRALRALRCVRRPASEPLLAAARDLVPAHRLHELAVDVPLALCIGWWRPAIYVSHPLLALEPDALRAVLAHEEAHRRSHDPLRLLLWRTLARSAEGIPIVADVVTRLELRAEVAADRFARQQVSRAALAQALLAMTTPTRSCPIHPAVESEQRAQTSLAPPTLPHPRRSPRQWGVQTEAWPHLVAQESALFTERLRYLQRPARTPLPSCAARRALAPASAVPALRLLTGVFAAPAALALLLTLSMLPAGSHLFPVAYACILHA